MSRKPKKQLLRELEKSQARARQLSGRLAIQNGSIAVFAGEPDFQELLYVRDLSYCLPYAMGFDSPCPLSRQSLQDRNYDLKVWQRLMDNGDVRKDIRHQLNGWRHEISELSVRANSLASLHSESPRGVLSGNEELKSFATGRGYFVTENGLMLTSTQEQFVQDLKRRAEADHVHQLPDSWLNVFRLVVWLADESAANRLLNSLAPFLPSQDDLRRSTMVECILGFLRRLKSKIRTDPELACSLWQTEFEKWPQGIIQEAGLIVPKNRHKPNRRLHKEIGKCQKLLKSIPALLPIRHVSAAAALCCCDESTVPIPKSMFTQSREPDVYPFTPGRKFSLRIDYLHDYSTDSNYDRMLRILVDCPSVMYGFEFDYVLRFLKARTSLEDLTWFMERDLFNVFECHDLNPQPLRGLFEFLEQHGAKPDYDAMAEVCGSLEKSSDLLFYAQLLKWLRRLPEHVLSKPFCQRIRGLLGSCHVYRGLRDAFRSTVSSWSSPPRRLQNRMDDLPDCPAGAVRPLSELAYYQKIAGQPVRLPGSVRDLIEATARRERERRSLVQRESDGCLSRGGAFRLHHLRATNDRDLTTKIIRQAHQARADAGVDALERMVCNIANRWWHNQLPSVQAPKSVSRIADICSWFTSMNDSQQTSVMEIFRTWSQRGSDYRRYLVHNQRWISFARSKGIDLDRWFAPCRIANQIGGSEVRIAVSSTPLQTIRMGCFFNTCLNLRDGCNRHSVVPNAYDANKAVLYAYDPQRRVVRARKLVAITNESELVSFTTYLNVDDQDQEERLGEAVELYCGEWARDVGLRLSDDGEVESISTEWYDDGCEAWTLAARNAWSSPKSRITSPVDLQLVSLMLSAV